MARSNRKIEEELSHLQQLRLVDEVDATGQARLLAALSSNPMAVVKAVQVIAEQDLREFAVELVRTFFRLLDADYKADPGCDGKIAILSTLAAWGSCTEPMLLRAVTYVQWEPVWSEEGRVDTAGRLRGMCAHELLRYNHPEAAYLIVKLLEDPTSEARETAVEAAAMLPGREGELLLRHKILTGDSELRVLLAAFSELARLAPQDSFVFFQEFLTGNAHVDVREAAALALGATRQPEALGVLAGCLERCLEPQERALLLQAIAQIRDDASFAYLEDLVARGPAASARAAIEALALWEGDEAREVRLRAAAQKSGDPTVMAKFLGVFPEAATDETAS